MSLDLRKHSCDDVFDRAQRSLDAKFDRATGVRKRRSVGFRTDRGSWVRIEVRDLARVDGRSWGVECASVLRGVAMPSWHQGFSWFDRDRGTLWRVDETEYVSDRPVKPGGILSHAPELPESWWATLSTSLNALAAHTTTRTATPNLEPITPDRFTNTIHDVYPNVDTTVEEWTAAHADLGWANLTAPTCFLLDWEDWGMAPRGWDAATLWSQSFAVPALAARISRERRADLETRTGKLVQLYHCAELIAAPDGYAGPLLEPARAAAAELLTDLQA